MAPIVGLVWIARSSVVAVVGICNICQIVIKHPVDSPLHLRQEDTCFPCEQNPAIKALYSKLLSKDRDFCIALYSTAIEKSDAYCDVSLEQRKYVLPN